MNKPKNLSGQKFGRLTALYRLHNYHKKGTYWLCVCDCGKFVIVHYNSLTRNVTKSCGCYNRECSSKRRKTHGHTRTRIYEIWCNIKSRCYNIKNHAYKNYGGRGIAVLHEWEHDFMAFYNWAMANGYNDTLTIDRIDVNGNYEPNNCRWVSYKQQSRNRRSNLNYTINGITHCLKEWCEIYNVNYKLVWSRLKRGWDLLRALTSN